MEKLYKKDNICKNQYSGGVTFIREITLKDAAF
jgi:hypothetical protein